MAMEEKKIVLIIGGMQKNQSRRNDGIVPCLCSAMGTGGGYVPMVVMKDEEDQSEECDEAGFHANQIGG